MRTSKKERKEQVQGAVARIAANAPAGMTDEQETAWLLQLRELQAAGDAYVADGRQRAWFDWNVAVAAAVDASAEMKEALADCPEDAAMMKLENAAQRAEAQVKGLLAEARRSKEGRGLWGVEALSEGLDALVAEAETAGAEAEVMAGGDKEMRAAIKRRMDLMHGRVAGVFAVAEEVVGRPLVTEAEARDENRMTAAGEETPFGAGTPAPVVETMPPAPVAAAEETDEHAALRTALEEARRENAALKAARGGRTAKAVAKAVERGAEVVADEPPVVVVADIHPLVFAEALEAAGEVAA